MKVSINLLRNYPESQFGGFTDIDGTNAFFLRVNALIESESVVLDVGCGRGEYSNDPVEIRRKLRSLKGKCKSVIGIDVDPIGQTNPCIDEFRLIKDGKWPIDSDSVNLCLCDFVVEHIENPDAFLSEAHRVLSPGGVLCIRTSNVFNYVGIGSLLVPNRFHAKMLARLQDGRQEEDVFPTYYACNSVWKLRRYLKRHGFQSAVYGYEAEPSYASFSKVLYYFCCLHQKFAPQFLKAAIFAFGRK